MPILFTAVEIPELIQASILDLRPKNLGIKESTNLHITLHYIGKVNDVEANLIQTILLKVKAKSYSQKINGVGVFNQTKAPHILWAGVNKCEELLNLHASVGQCLQEIGLKLESRQYSPHITVARIKKTNEDLVESYINKYSDFNANFDVKSFSLFSSKRTKLGAIYKKLYSYDF